MKRMISHMLEDLKEEKLKRFRDELRDREREGEPKVRRTDLQGNDCYDTAEVLVSTFTASGALRVTLELLRLIGCNQEADKLGTPKKRVDLKRPHPPNGKVEDLQRRVPSNGQVEDLKRPDPRHFVDIHRTELIQKVGLVSPILDELLDHNVINQEMYDTIRSESTSQEQMRLLYSGPLKGCGNKGKDILYRILEANQPMLIENLEGQ
ncbi:apoptosis-associated speck-like protein containing a CARD [Diretmus argenteus]